MVPPLYEIRIRGRLTPGVASEFQTAALAVRVAPVETVLSGYVADQSALHGLLRRIEGLGLELVEVRRVADCEGFNEELTR